MKHVLCLFCGDLLIRPTVEELRDRVCADCLKATRLEIEEHPFNQDTPQPGRRHA